MSTHKLTGLMRVRENELLVLPPNMRAQTALWLKPGGVVDTSIPALHDFLRGQEFKLEPAPKDVVADPLPRPIALAIEKATPSPTARAATQQAASQAAARSGATSGIQKPDAPRTAQESQKG